MGTGETEEVAIEDLRAKLSITREEFESHVPQVVKAYVWDDGDDLVAVPIGFGPEFPHVNAIKQGDAEDAIRTWATALEPPKLVSFRPPEYMLGSTPGRRPEFQWGSERGE